LASEIYIDSGVRGMERGIVSAGRDPKTGKHRYPKLELVRLTLPRRVYTQSHIDVAVESIAEVWDKRKSIKGLKMIYEPKYLRFFQGRFARLK
jgi:tyrosine phenol-lyase